MIRAAIVGLGRWGRALVEASNGIADLRFTRAVTRTRGNADAFCRDRGIALSDSYDDLLRAADIDAIVLATPHRQHATQAHAAIAAGKHVFVEKPLTLELDSARAVADAAQAAGLVLAVGLARRFHPSIAELRRRAGDGQLGDIVAMVAQHTTSTAQFVPPENWRASPLEAPGGAFTAVGIHVLDHMIELAGAVRDVRCVTSRVYPGPSDDTTTVMLRFVAGASGLIFCSVATATNFEFTTYGSRGLIEISRPDLSRLRYAPVATVAPTGVVPPPPDEMMNFSGFNMLAAEMTAFARAIEGKEPYPVPVADVLQGMAVFEAIVESARSSDIVAVRNCL